jgi:hypothetical protein
MYIHYITPSWGCIKVRNKAIPSARRELTAWTCGMTLCNVERLPRNYRVPSRIRNLKFYKTECEVYGGKFRIFRRICKVMKKHRFEDGRRVFFGSNYRVLYQSLIVINRLDVPVKRNFRTYVFLGEFICIVVIYLKQILNNHAYFEKIHAFCISWSLFRNV